MNDDKSNTDATKESKASIPQERKSRLQLVPSSGSFDSQIKCTIEESRAFMESDLAKSGLVPEDINAYPIIHWCPAYLIPYRDVEGEELDGMYRVRQDNKDERYDQPGRNKIGDECLHPFFPIGLSGETDVLYICEGEKKAATLWKKLRRPCAAMGGMGNWRKTSGTDEIHPAWPALIEKLDVKNIVLIPDGDVHRIDISKEYGKFKAALEGLKLHVDIKELPDPEDKIDELLVAWGDEAEEKFDGLRSISGVAETVDRLVEKYHLTFHLRGTKGDKYPVLYENADNCSRLTKSHPAFEGIWHNDDNNHLYSGKHLLREDEHLYDMHTYFQHYLNMPTVPPRVVQGAVLRAGLERRRSPLRERISGLVWDGVPRLETMFIDLCGVPDSEFAREVGRKWMPSICKRIFQAGEGCKVDWMLIAVGPQGIGKSSFPACVIGQENVVEYYGDEAQVKDNIAKKHQGTIVSMEEFDQMNGKALGGFKYDVTATKDAYRKPYRAETETHYRSYVYYASTNNHDFLQKDPSGYRRYAPLAFGQVLFAELARVVDQLWAEAYAAMVGGLDVSQVEGATQAAKEHVMEDEYLTELAHNLERLENDREYAQSMLNQWPQTIGRHDGSVWIKAAGMRALAGLPIDDRDRYRARALKSEFRAHHWVFRKGTYGGGVSSNVWHKKVNW